MAAGRAEFGLVLGRRLWLACTVLLIILIGLVLHHRILSPAVAPGKPSMSSVALAATTHRVGVIGDASAADTGHPAAPSAADRTSIRLGSGWGDSCHRDIGWMWDAFFVVALVLLGLSMLPPPRGSYLIRLWKPSPSQFGPPNLRWRGSQVDPTVLCVSRT